MATHQPILIEYIQKTINPILEIGAGDSSTRQIHFGTANEILTIDNESEWIEKYSDLKDERHNFILYSDYKELFDKDNKKWGVVFIDALTWEIREYAIRKYINSDYVIIHDSEWMFTHVISRDEFSKIYKYWKEFKDLGLPFTVVASNINEL